MSESIEFKTKIIFRYWEDEVIAIFPEDLGDNEPYTCSSYQHMGQHGICNPQFIIENSRLATPEEYADLKKELENQCGYNLQIIKRNSQAYLDIRRKKLEEF